MTIPPRGLLSLEAIEFDLMNADKLLAEEALDEAMDAYASVLLHIESVIKNEQRGVGIVAIVAGAVVGLLLIPAPYALIGILGGGLLGKHATQHWGRDHLRDTPYYSLYLRAQKGVLNVENRIDQRASPS